MNNLTARWRSRAPHEAARIAYWVYGYFAFEWLFFATKSSVVSSADGPTRILMLLVPPLFPLAWAIPAQLLFTAIDRGGEGSRRWGAAILPATVALLLLIIGVENFARTTLGVSIVDVTPASRVLAITCVIVLWAGLIRRAAGRPAAPSRRYVAVAAILVTTSLLTLALTLFTSRAEPAPPNLPNAPGAAPRLQPNILLIGIDGIPAQRMSVYGATRQTTPFLESLARRGTLFENAFPNAGVTCGSLISVLTGRRPTETHVFRCPVYLDGAMSEQHLPAILRSAGYSSAQIGVRGYADAVDWNMRGAFDEVNGRVLPEEESLRSRSLHYARMRRFRREVEARITERVLHIAGIRSMTDTYRLLTGEASDREFTDKARLASAREFILGRREPWLLQIHLLDTHCCDFGFAPPRFSSKTREGDAQWMIDRTDDALRQVDGYIAQLHRLLQVSGQLERTMIIVYSDHSVGWTTNERIPLLVVLPGQRSPERVGVNVQLLDIAPTVLHYMRVPQPDWMSGRSLLDRSTLDPDRPVYALWRAWRADDAGVQHHLLNDARTASVVICNQWVEMSLSDGAVLSRGFVEGHTRPCTPGDPASTAPAQILATHLRANGYPLSDSAGRRSPAEHRHASADR